MMSPLIADRLVVVERAEVRFPGHSFSLDGMNTQLVGEQLFALTWPLGPCELLLDFGNVDSVCAAALAMLLRLHKRLAAGGGRLRLLNVNPHAHQVFEITKLHAILDVRPAETAPTLGDDHAGSHPKAR
jgi:anti-anti-sigma factor